MNRFERLMTHSIRIKHELTKLKQRNKNHNFGEEFVLLTDVQPMMPTFSEPEQDYEGDMILTELSAIIDKAQTIKQMISENSEFPAWLQSKITLASHNISAAHDYIKYRNT